MEEEEDILAMCACVRVCRACDCDLLLGCSKTEWGFLLCLFLDRILGEIVVIIYLHDILIEMIVDRADDKRQLELKRDRKDDDDNTFPTS